MTTHQQGTHGQQGKNDALKKPQTSQPEARKSPPGMEARLVQRAILDPGQLSPKDILQLQRVIGNQAVGQLLGGGATQTPTLADTPSYPILNPIRQQTAIVQAQQAPTSDNSASTSGLHRVQAAIAASNLQTLITLQYELRKQMLTDPLHPPEDARAGLATARHWLMDQIAVIRDRYASRITAASTGNSSGTDATGAVETLEISMDGECTPYLNALMAGDPQYRYEHFDAGVSEKVFAAVRLHAARRGVGQIGHRAQAEAEARSHGRLPSGSWCGAFAYTQAEQGGGFDSYWVGHMQGEGGIRTALAYGGVMARTWIWAFDHWESLQGYHARLHSSRWYEAIHRAPPARGIQAGDLVLIDNAFGTNPDHITTAISFDGRFLTTVGGNQGTSDPSDEAGVSRSARAFDLQNNPEPNDVRRTNAGGQKIREVDPRLGPKHVRVHGIGRWSVVDYEQHIYRISAQRPTAPPSTTELAAIG